MTNDQMLLAKGILPKVEIVYSLPGELGWTGIKVNPLRQGSERANQVADEDIIYLDENRILDRCDFHGKGTVLILEVHE